MMNNATFFLKGEKISMFGIFMMPLIPGVRTCPDYNGTPVCPAILTGDRIER
jgi:hypothetical protein